MAIYHFSAKIVGAAKGQSVVATASYIMGEALHDERLARTFNYTSKDEVVYSNVLLPENAPERLADPSTLWNEVTHIEKQKNKNAQYARHLDIALPNEWSLEERLEGARQFVQEAFVDKGMIAHYALHNKDGNPHLHILLTLRPFTEKGEWGAKEKKAFKLDNHGERIPVIDPNTGEQKIDKRNRKQWVRETVTVNDWNSPATLKRWRKEWADFANERLPEENHIDHRSFKERGIEILPTIHEGYSARKVEESGGISDRCEYNREVKRVNKLYDKHAELGEKISRVGTQISQRTARVESGKREVSPVLQRVRRDTTGIGEKLADVRKTLSRIRARMSVLDRRIEYSRGQYSLRTERRKRDRGAR